HALNVITAVGGGKALFIATCNRIATLPPELRRRFQLGTWFFDLPTEEERRRIWNLYLNKYAQLDDSDMPQDEGWTGAEIKQCAKLASELGITLKEAARFIVPVSRAAAEEIENLRRQADGRFLSASYPGVYQVQGPEQQGPGTSRKRALRLGNK